MLMQRRGVIREEEVQEFASEELESICRRRMWEVLFLPRERGASRGRVEIKVENQ